VQAGFPGLCPQVAVHGHARHPGQLLAREHERPRVSFLSWHPRVDQDVLELAGTGAAGRAHAQPRRTPPEAKLQAGPQMGRAWLFTAGARAGADGCLHRLGNARHDLNARTHDPKAEAAGQVDPGSATLAGGEPDHGLKLGAAQRRQAAAGLDVQHAHELGGDRRTHGGDGLA
jgi:hypothetical protein